MPEPDDILPGQRGALPTSAEVAEREVAERSPVGCWSRLRSRATIAVAILAVVVVYLLFGRTD
ncbi:hypothetical protein [Phenylobacterium sp.]|uniref:hypothetical protein n=1 Tax=Phenylobacterium sp. TaxID=1871053 RepID=UPI00286E8844|nr:hypothetical protein [Phenylobacterium sp.]